MQRKSILLSDFISFILSVAGELVCSRRLISCGSERIWAKKLEGGRIDAVWVRTQAGSLSIRESYLLQRFEWEVYWGLESTMGFRGKHSIAVHLLSKLASMTG